MTVLTSVDWEADTYRISDSIVADLSTSAEIDRQEMIRRIARMYQETDGSEHHVYCLSIDQGGDECWYVGETQNIADRISTHVREKDVTNIERIEPVDPDNALDRERELSYQIAIEKGSTDIYGGK